MVRFCKNCGTQLEEEALFCPVCGTAVAATHEVPQSEYVPQPEQYAPQPEQYAQPVFQQDQSAPQQDPYAQPVYPQEQYIPQPDPYAPQPEYVPPQDPYAQPVYPQEQYIPQPDPYASPVFQQDPYAPQPEYAPQPDPYAQQQFQQQFQQGYTQPGAGYAPPGKKLTKPVLIIIIAAAAAAVFLIIFFLMPADNKEDDSDMGDLGTLTIGGDNADDEDVDDDTGIDNTDVDTPDEPSAPPPPPPKDDPPPADNNFKAASVDDFPSGNWSVNRIAKEFGPPNQAMGIYIPDNKSVMVFLLYSNAYVHFNSMEASKFSYYDDSPAGQQGFELDDKDKDLDLDLMGVTINGPGVSFPFGIEIGKSTKSKVKESYGEEPLSEFSNAEINFMQYEFSSLDRSGYIMYYFDQSDILQSVMVMYIGY